MGRPKGEITLCNIKFLVDNQLKAHAHDGISGDKNNTKEIEWWSKDKGQFEEWVRKDTPHGEDPAQRLKWSEKINLMPPQCIHCENYGRKISYRKDTNIMEITYSYCEKCRYYALKMNGMKWFWFTKSREGDRNPYEDLQPIVSKEKSKTRKHVNKTKSKTKKRLNKIKSKKRGKKVIVLSSDSDETSSTSDDSDED